MFNIAICDDDKVLCEWFSDIILSNKAKILLPYNIAAYYSGSELCEQLNKGAVSYTHLEQEQ